MNMLMMLNVLSSLRELRRHEQWTRSQLVAYQAKALQRLRVHAYAESPFYQKFHKGYTDSPLSKLPVLTKSMVMEHFDSIRLAGTLDAMGFPFARVDAIQGCTEDILHLPK